MIAVIAGAGNLPLEACKSFISQKKQFFVICLFPEQNGDALKLAVGETATIHTRPVVKLGAILSLIKEEHTTEVLMIGKVDKKMLLGKLSLDFFAVKLLAQAATKSDTVLMELVVSTIEKQGIAVLSQHEVLTNLLVAPGVLTGTINETIQQSVNLGLDTAQKLSHCDIGQTVIVKNKMVLAVEAIEGTDTCIKRGMDLGKSGIIICKAARPDQNKKFDLPTLGPDSLDGLKKGDVSAIAWQSSHTFIVDKEMFIDKAKQLGITLLSV